MSYPRKYTPEQRRQASEMYWEDREEPMEGIRAKGRYTLREIEERTGVNYKVAWLIARGYK